MSKQVLGRIDWALAKQLAQQVLIVEAQMDYVDEYLMVVDQDSAWELLDRMTDHRESLLCSLLPMVWPNPFKHPDPTELSQLLRTLVRIGTH